MRDLDRFSKIQSHIYYVPVVYIIYAMVAELCDVSTTLIVYIMSYYFI